SSGGNASNPLRSYNTPPVLTHRSPFHVYNCNILMIAVEFSSKAAGEGRVRARDRARRRPGIAGCFCSLALCAGLACQAATVSTSTTATAISAAAVAGTPTTGCIKESDQVRARQLGIVPGVLSPGPLNAITDVAGVLVGHTTLIVGETIRTGATAIL